MIQDRTICLDSESVCSKFIKLINECPGLISHSNFYGIGTDTQKYDNNISPPGFFWDKYCKQFNDNDHILDFECNSGDYKYAKERVCKSATLQEFFSSFSVKTQERNDSSSWIIKCKFLRMWRSIRKGNLNDILITLYYPLMLLYRLQDITFLHCLLLTHFLKLFCNRNMPRPRRSRFQIEEYFNRNRIWNIIFLSINHCSKYGSHAIQKKV